MTCVPGRTYHERGSMSVPGIEERSRCPTIEVEQVMDAEAEVSTLEYLFKVRGEPEHIRSNNGSEFIAPSSDASEVGRRGRIPYGGSPDVGCCGLNRDTSSAILTAYDTVGPGSSRRLRSKQRTSSRPDDADRQSSAASFLNSWAAWRITCPRTPRDDRRPIATVFPASSGDGDNYSRPGKLRPPRSSSTVEVDCEGMFSTAKARECHAEMAVKVLFVGHYRVAYRIALSGMRSLIPAFTREMGRISQGFGRTSHNQTFCLRCYQNLVGRWLIDRFNCHFGMSVWGHTTHSGTSTLGDLRHGIEDAP